jgi:hypothetical protein
MVARAIQLQEGWLCELWAVSGRGQELVQNGLLDCCFAKEVGLSSLDIRKHSQAASMFLGVSQGACVPNGAALRVTTEAGPSVGEQYCHQHTIT